MVKMMNKQKGFSLLEIMLVMSLVASALILAFSVYSKVKASADAKANVEIISGVAAEVKGIYTSGNYSTLYLGMYFPGIWPDNMQVNTATVLNQWGGRVQLARSFLPANSGGNSHRYFFIRYDDVPPEVCVRMIPMALNAGFGHISVHADHGRYVVVNTYRPGVGPASSGYANARETLDVERMVSLCNEQETASIRFFTR